MLSFLAETPDRYRALGGFLAAADQQPGGLSQRVLAYLVIDLFVAQVALDSQSGALCSCDDLLSVAVGVLGDGGDHRLQRREPKRQVTGIMFEENAGKALERAEHRAVDHHRR